jgi:hypothetical protein
MLFRQTRIFLMAVVIVVLAMTTGCKKYLNIPLPVNEISGSDAYGSDVTTAGVLNDIYYNLELPGRLSGSGGLGNYAGLYTDELQTVSTSSAVLQTFYVNKITGNNGGGYSWNQLYPQINTANVTIEAMRTSSLPFKNQWLGEALFLRGLLYYYLTNIYGDVALALTSDYVVNGSLSRSPQADVYKQIIADLKEAQGLLSTDYVDYTGAAATDRARPNKAAATALLARVYLYTGDWANAEAQAGAVIGNTAYAIETPANVFLVTSRENIWGITPTQGLAYVVADPLAYQIKPGTTPAASLVGSILSPQLVSSFEPNDARFTNWVGVSTVGATNYYFANKYKIISSAPALTETLVMLRLSEQYLIRAEARAEQNNLPGAISDINVIRTRAALPGTTASSQAEILAAIAQERRIEFFTELGHRFFDLKRTGSIDAVMGVVSPQKGSSWASYMQYWPILTSETQTNTKLKQTPGYPD